MSRELALLGLAEAAALVRARQVSPVELTDAVLAQADRWEPHIQSLLLRLDEQARAAASAAEREIAGGGYRGALHGTNEFPFLIGYGGISVLTITSLALNHKVSRDRIATGIPRLDSMLGGRGF